MQYWLIKSEPSAYSIEDLERDGTTAWSGVRNYQARNFMKIMRKGDLALFYHSSADPKAVVGIATVVKEAHPDLTALKKSDSHYDPKATKQDPIWTMVDFGFLEKFPNPIPLRQIKLNPSLAGIMLAARGSRLSIQPVSKEHFEIIKKMGSIH